MTQDSRTWEENTRRKPADRTNHLMSGVHSAPSQERNP